MKIRPRWMWAFAMLAACESPSAGRLDAAYLVSVRYVMDARSAFFPGPIERICLGGALGDLADSFRSTQHAQPTIIRCSDSSDSPSPRVATLRTTNDRPRWVYAWDETVRYIELDTSDDGGAGGRPEPLLSHWLRRLTTNPPRGVRIQVQYSDARVMEAGFSCWLIDHDGSWVLEGCRPTRVEWRGVSGRELSPAGCWALEWAPVRSASTDGLPEFVRLTENRLQTPWDTTAFRVAPMVESDSAWIDWDWGAHWELGAGPDWRWSREESGVFRLIAGGGYEGIHVSFVMDPQGPALRGAGSRWTDYEETLRSPEPDWQVVARSIECG